MQNQSLDINSSDSEVNPIVLSIVNDLVTAVDIQHTILTKLGSDFNKNMESLNASMDLMDTSNDIITERSFSTCFLASPEDGINTTVVQNRPIDLFSPDIYAIDETTGCRRENKGNDKEIDSSPKRSNDSDYVKLSRVSPHSQTTGSSHWNYTSNNDNKYPNNGYDYKSITEKYDNLLDSWAHRGTEPPKPNPRSRSSLYRTFDPLMSKRDISYREDSNDYKTTLKDLNDYKTPNDFNDSTDLLNHFSKFKITDSPKSFHTMSSQTIPLSKPDVLASTIPDRNNDDLKHKLFELEKQLVEKDEEVRHKEEEVKHKEEEIRRKDEELRRKDEELRHKDEELRRKDEVIKCKDEEIRQRDEVMNGKEDGNEILMKELEKQMNENQKLLNLINTLHLINEELVITSSQELQKLRDCVHCLNSEKTEAINAKTESQRSLDELNNKYETLKNQLLVINENKCDFESQLISLRMQCKKSEMKISALERQLDQKTTENNGLSALVDELISKVRK